MAEEMEADEVLELRSHGRNFSPVLISKRSQIMDTESEVNDPEQSPETWWSGLSISQREFVQELANTVRHLEGDRDKVLEIRNEDGRLRATLVLELRRPTGGEAETN